jgi:hypothetical protein
MFEPIKVDPFTSKVSPLHPTRDDQLRVLLRDHVQQLKRIIPVISVSILALRRQNAELDEDIAAVLHDHASTPLDMEVEELESLLESLATRRVGEAAA